MDGHRPGTPVRGVAQGRFQRLDDHVLDRGITQASRRARPRLIQQARYPRAHEAAAPLADRGQADVQRGGNRGVGLANGAARDDLRPHREGLGGGRPSGVALQRLAFARVRYDLGYGPAESNVVSSLLYTTYDRRPTIVSCTYDSVH